jgi:hypothetical protein
MLRILRRAAAVAVVAVLISALTPGVASAAVPTVPAGLTAIAGNESAVLSWTASSNTPTDYIIEYSADGFVTTTMRFFDGVSTATSATVTGLTNGVVYTFQVKGFNVDGTSAASTTTTALPYSNHTPNDLAVFDACPASLIPAGGFTDTTSLDVGCVKYYGITRGTTATTFSPIDFVTRWQMALFLTRMVLPAGATLPSGADQGFSDISGKSTEIRTAINQIKQLGITVGKTATTFAPDDFVTREEMALFMSRLLKASQTGPGGNEEFVTGTSGAKEIKSLDTDHNFADLGTVTLMETQNAIISLWNLGVTEVIAATLYQPNVNISRLNMAQMMARALDHTNARPAGLNIQGSAYSGTGSLEVTVSVTQRTADFLPVVGSLVDSFKYRHTTTVGYSRFSLDGSCAQTVATVVAVNSCYIDATDRATDSNGNIATFIEVVTASTWDVYAWTAATGTFYDNDLHGGDVGKITVIAS